MEKQQTFFDFAAEAGLTKHHGSHEATAELVRLCHIGAGSYILDVGCGVGETPCFLAQRYGCRVMGVDIRPKMVERSAERARREGVADRVEFQVADAQDLPFADAVFDAVITESVTSFPADKQRAVDEYVRVTRPGGYIGLAESTWLKTPPPPELIAWVSQDVGACVQPLVADEWTGLLRNAGLGDITVLIYPIDAKKEALRIFRLTLRWAQTFAVVREDSMFDIGLGYPALRRMLAELGHRLAAAGAIPQANDIYWLERAEVEHAAAALDRGEAQEDFGERIRARQAVWRAEQLATPPQQLPPKLRVMGIKPDAFLPISAEKQTGDLLRGVAASPGQVTAPACILRGPEDFVRMRPGDILVAEIPRRPGRHSSPWPPASSPTSAGR